MAATTNDRKKSVIIVGGGLVGALNACFMARRNFKVDLYEMRQDIRTMEVVRGRSINLAMSVRAREALKRVGLEDTMVQHGIPMHARMIHDLDGTCRAIPYGKKDQYIMSVDRRHLNEVLLTAAEKHPDIQMHFEHKLIECEFNAGSAIFQKKDGSQVKVSADLIIGCDGAYSGVRQQMMKKTLLDYEQVFIPHGYMELNMPPTADNEYAMPTNYLHIWARNEYMMIALPNQDKSFTVTLFMPFDIFKTLTTEDAIVTFFKENFADSIPLLGQKTLVETVHKTKALPMISVKCSPYHVKDKAVILGDAAHAMVPFYGQGMNCGFEDCLVLDDILDKCNDDIAATLNEYTSFRSVDAKAMCDLAFYNYIEMRKSVNSRLFLIRKRVDTFLSWLFPKTWVPLYTSVSFSRIRYHECIKNKQWQDKILKRATLVGGPMLLVSGYYLYKRMDVHLEDTSVWERGVHFLTKLGITWNATV